MRLATLNVFAVAASTLALSACNPEPPPAATAATAAPAATSSMQAQPAQGGVTFTPGQVTPPPVSAYTGSQRGTNSPLGATYQVPGNLPVTAYTGSQRGTNSPLGFQRNPGDTSGSTPVIQPSPAQPQ